MKTLLIAALFVPAVALAAEPIPGLRKYNCLTCHNVEMKLVGPSYKEVAKKYTSKDKAALVASVQKGSVGKWGQMPMPPNNVPNEDASKMVDWILNLK